MPSKSPNKSHKGQILVAMIALMVLSLSLGITLAGTLIGNTRSQIQTDDSSKARAASEAILEKLLLLPNTTLEDYINNNNCGSACSWSTVDVTGQTITAHAVLSYAGNSSNTFLADLETTKAFQLNLKSYTSGKTVDICWNTPASIYASYIKDTSGVISSDAHAYNAVGTLNPENNFLQAAPKYEFLSCFTVTASDTPLMVRLRSYYLNTPIFIVPEAGQSLPKQGILITATGTSGDVSKTTAALKTSATLPGIFDYAIYQKSPNDPLSNVTL